MYNDILVGHGYEPIGFIKGYAPHMQPEETLDKFSNLMKAMGLDAVAELPINIAGLTAEFKPGRKWNGHDLQRVGFFSERDIRSVTQEYLNVVSNVVYHIDDISRLRSFERVYREEHSREKIRPLLDEAYKYVSGNPKQDELSDDELLKDKANPTAGDMERAWIADVTQFLQSEEVSPIVGFGHNRTIKSRAEGRELLKKYIEHARENESETADKTGFGSWLLNYTNTLAGKQSILDRSWEAGFKRRSLNFGLRMNRLYSMSAVAGNLSSVLNQLSQMPETLSSLGELNVIKAVIDMSQGHGNNAAFAERSDYLTNLKSFDLLAQSVGGKVVSAVFSPIIIANDFMAAVTVRAAYNKGLSEGMSDAAAMKYADAEGRRIMGDRSKGMRPMAFDAKNPVMKAFTTFQLEAVNGWFRIISDLPYEVRRVSETRGKTAAARFLARRVFGYMIWAFILNRLFEKLYGGTPAPRDVLGLVTEFLGGGAGLSANSYLETLIDNAWEEMEGERPFGTVKRRGGFNVGAGLKAAGGELAADIPFLQSLSGVFGVGDMYLAMPNVGTTGTQLAQAATSGDSGGAKALDIVTIAAARLIPGGNQLRKTVKGVRSAIRGGEYDKNGNLKYPIDGPFDRLHTVLFGLSSTAAARDYYVGGYKAFTDIQQEHYDLLVRKGRERDEAYDMIRTAERRLARVKGSTQEEVEAALRAKHDLTNLQRAALWQLKNASWKPDNNPFGRIDIYKAYGVLTR